MAVFHIYGDESGKLSAQADYTSFCGYVAHASTWQAFAEMWNNCRLKWQVPPIHMSRIMFPDSKDDAWKQVKDKWGESWAIKRNDLLGELAEIVRSSGIVCVGAIVNAKHFRLVADSDPAFKKLYRDPIHMAFHTFVMRGIDKIEVIDKHSPIGIVVDDDEEFGMQIHQQFNTLKKNLDSELQKTHDERVRDSIRRAKNRLHAISFVNDDSYPGVQVADMIAYEARRIMVERLTQPDATSALYDELTFGRSNQPKFYSAENIDDLKSNLQEAIANGIVTV